MTSRILRHARKDHAGLDDNPRHNFAMNRALLVYPSGAVFTFIPKNGCTTLRVSLAMANGVLPDLEDWEWVHRNNRTFCASLREVVTAPFTFVVLRCPHARLASVFLDKMVEGGPLGRRFLAREGKERDLASVTFRDFVTMLDTPALLNFDPHWRPQVDFLVYEDYDLWVPLERFAQHIPQIEAGAGMKIQDARQLSGHGTDRLEAVGKGRPGLHADTPRSKLAALRKQGKAPDYAALYDDDLVARVARLYSQDGALYAERFDSDTMLFPKAFSTTGQQT